MAEEWLTYGSLSERLGVSAEAARQKAIRNRWPRRTANDGRTQVRVDLDETAPPRPRKPPRPTPEQTVVDPPADTRTLDALEAHIATLKALAAAAETALARERERADSESRRADHERGCVEAERERADVLARRLEEAQERMDERAAMAEQLDALRARLAEMEAARNRSWWHKIIG